MLRQLLLWTRQHLPGLLLGLAVGTVAGALVHYASLLSGAGLYLLTGGVAGVLVVAVLKWFGRTAMVTEVAVSVPQFSTVTFAVTPDHRILALRIFRKLVTRIAVQTLEGGYAREALTSLYTLFGEVRDLLDADATVRAGAGRPPVDVLAMNMLARQLHPFLSRWHPRLRDWELHHPDGLESAWPENAGFRADLAELQTRLRTLAISFAQLAGYDRYTEISGLGGSTEAPPPLLNPVRHRYALAA